MDISSDSSSDDEIQIYDKPEFSQDDENFIEDSLNNTEDSLKRTRDVFNEAKELWSANNDLYSTPSDGNTDSDAKGTQHAEEQNVTEKMSIDDNLNLLNEKDTSFSTHVQRHTSSTKKHKKNHTSSWQLEDNNEIRTRVTGTLFPIEGSETVSGDFAFKILLTKYAPWIPNEEAFKHLLKVIKHLTKASLVRKNASAELEPPLESLKALRQYQCDVSKSSREMTSLWDQLKNMIKKDHGRISPKNLEMRKRMLIKVYTMEEMEKEVLRAGTPDTHSRPQQYPPNSQSKQKPQQHTKKISRALILENDTAAKKGQAQQYDRFLRGNEFYNWAQCEDCKKWCGLEYGNSHLLPNFTCAVIAGNCSEQEDSEMSESEESEESDSTMQMHGYESDDGFVVETSAPDSTLVPTEDFDHMAYVDYLMEQMNNKENNGGNKCQHCSKSLKGFTRWVFRCLGIIPKGFCDNQCFQDSSFHKIVEREERNLNVNAVLSPRKQKQKSYFRKGLGAKRHYSIANGAITNVDHAGIRVQIDIISMKDVRNILFFSLTTIFAPLTTFLFLSISLYLYEVNLKKNKYEQRCKQSI